ncbi:MAG: TPM domain-containing protein [Rhizobiales bacterium]|nr:TPM domain-containing protein [Hyphomicrobiales bacterium]
MEISAEDKRRVSAAIYAAEAGTSGEIVCVFTKASSDAMALPIVLAAAISLALPWVFVAMTEMPIRRILVLQLVTFVVAALLLCQQRIRVALMPRAARRAVANQVAMQQFRSYGVVRTRDRTGILIFVSLAERYARIIVDEGIAARVPQSVWQQAVDVLVRHMREGRIAEGFVAATELCGTVLATHFPSDATNPNELRNRLHVI